ncbi:hypothetical protein RHMOL_Rhmol10G0152700 [Rhododendron molle]|uniref:Uncharacterized protein n=4 Tax=Rhododendron molle TaxID=49168 RepID=A0ACC0M417_RHOML|nr:hypothetical protein RHMOL_Rhmol10G0152700 [Rhododendron molle]KAI8535145.1 hypothetical protein RHMOL_Rhmol10G0152700 [Rhododendron molle]KAI8535148.1 hypothetical protein RHMOL_Rhmol10G0152700 [Rhododendron molle]KAI8535150.1 hypothetical protein RHMOL_Rhmol10G0152700 [Rhododendron molle]
MFVSSNARKRKMVQTAVDAIRKSATSRMSKLHQEMSNIQDLTTSVQEEWTNYIQKLSSPEMKASIQMLNSCSYSLYFGPVFTGTWEFLRELLTVARSKLILADFVLHKMITSSEFDGIFAIELDAGTAAIMLNSCKLLVLLHDIFDWMDVMCYSCSLMFAIGMFCCWEVA